MSGRATITQVAKRAGVSVSTVSLAINHPHRVNEVTRRAIIAVAVEMGYRGAQVATGRRIAVAAPFSSYPSYYTRLTGILAANASIGAHIIVHDLPSTAAEDAPVLDTLPVKADLDGIIVMGAPLSPHATESPALPGPPVVLVDVPDNTQRHPDIPTVLIDDHRGGALLGEHLARLGHTRVAFLHEEQRSPDYLSAGMLRARGIAEHVECVSVPVRTADDLPSIVADVHRDPSITAMAANHDDLAASIAATPAHQDAPLPLTGYDGSAVAAAWGLTTVWQPFEESVRAAFGLLMQVLEGEHTSLSVMSLAPRLVVDRSTTSAARRS